MSFAELLEKGRLCLDDGDNKGALQSLQQALQLDASAEAWLLLAEAEMNADQPAKARKSINKGLQLEPENIELLYAHGDLCLEEGDETAALQAFQKIIALDSTESDAWVSKAMVHFNVDDLAAAEQSCRQALNIDPESVFALTTLGSICVAGEREDEACECYEKAIALDAEEAQPYLSLGELYYDRGQLEEAEQVCLKGLELDASLPMGYLTLGYIYLDMDRNQESIDNFQQFLRIEKSPAAKQIREEVAAVIDGLK